MTIVEIPVTELGNKKGKKKKQGRKIQKDFFLSRESRENFTLSHIPSGALILHFQKGIAQLNDCTHQFSTQEIKQIANRMREIRQFFPRSWEELQSLDFDSPEALALRGCITGILFQVADS